MREGEIKSKRYQRKVMRGVWNDDGRRFKQAKNAVPHIKKLRERQEKPVKKILKTKDVN